MGLLHLITGIALLWLSTGLPGEAEGENVKVCAIKDCTNIVPDCTGDPEKSQKLSHDLENLKVRLSKTLQEYTHFSNALSMRSPAQNFELGVMSPVSHGLTTDNAAKKDHILFGRVTWMVGWAHGVTALLCATSSYNCSNVMEEFNEAKTVLDHLRKHMCLNDTSTATKSCSLYDPLAVHTFNVTDISNDALLRDGLQALTWARDRIKQCKALAGSLQCKLTVPRKLPEAKQQKRKGKKRQRRVEQRQKKSSKDNKKGKK